MEAADRSEHHLVMLRRGPEGRLDVLFVTEGDGWASPWIESKSAARPTSAGKVDDRQARRAGGPVTEAS